MGKKKFRGMKPNETKNVLDKGMKNSLKSKDNMKQMKKIDRIEHEIGLKIKLYLHIFQVVHVGHQNKVHVWLQMEEQLIDTPNVINI